MVFNKMDRYSWVEKDEDDLRPPTKENISLEEMKKTWMGRVGSPCIFISAKHRQNIDAFRKLLYDTVAEIHKIRYPYDNFLY